MPIRGPALFQVDTILIGHYFAVLISSFYDFFAAFMFPSLRAPIRIVGLMRAMCTDHRLIFKRL